MNTIDQHRKFPIHTRAKELTQIRTALHGPSFGRASARWVSWFSSYAMLWSFFLGSTPAQTPDDFDPGCDGIVRSLAVQANGKVLVGGQFTTLGGQVRNSIGRLNADGILDSSFNPGVDGPGGPQVYSLAVQTDGKILVAGDFSSLGGQRRTNIGRLNADGSVDGGFNPNANSRILSQALQADGKILVGGSFVTLGGQTRNRIGRLNRDGSLDNSFNPGANAEVDCLAVQPDGKILVCGSFTNLSGQACSYIGRLNANGSFDTSFKRDANYTNKVYSVALQADGKILLGGGHTTLLGPDEYCIHRLNADGSLDSSFNRRGHGTVHSLATQADGKVLAGGYFYMLVFQPLHIGRFNADGSLDSSFNASVVPNDVFSLGLQADGKVLVGGLFFTLDGQPREHIGRLNNNTSATQDLTYDGSKLLWRRGGTNPEVWRTTFEVSTNGQDWIFSAAGSRVPNGWQLSPIALPERCTVRTRGFTTGGQGNGSSWFVESLWQLPRPRLGIDKVAERVFTLSLFGNIGERLELRTATNSGGPWGAVQSFTLTNSVETRLWTNQSDTERHFQAQPQ
jgi:uncharacterized delta-60 repeat protein